MEMNCLFERFFRFVITTVIDAASRFTLVEFCQQTRRNIASAREVDARVDLFESFASTFGQNEDRGL